MRRPMLCNRSASNGQGRLAALTAAMALVSTVGCAEPRPRPSTVTAEDTVKVIYYSASPETWQDFGQPVVTLLFMPLMHEHDGEMEGRLARSRELSADGRTWTYHLRTDVRWHDGVPVTASDIEFTIQLFQNLDHKNPLAAQMGRNRSVRVIDDSTFTITFDRYREDFVSAPREVFLPRHLLEDLDPSTMGEWEFWNAPVGNGAYRFARMVPNQLIELEANPDYFAGPPGIGRVFIRVMGTARSEFNAGEADIFTEIGPGTAAVFEEDPRFRIYRSMGSRGERIYWNHRHPILGDVRVRRALSLTVDRAELAAISGFPAELPTWDVPVSSNRVSRGSLSGIPESLAPDLTRARELLSEAGWEDRDGDGIRERDGQPLRFALLVSQEGVAVILQQQFHRVGVRADIHPNPRPVLFPRFEAGDFEAAIERGIGSRERPNGLLSGVRPEFVGYEGPELIQLDAVLDTTFLPEARERLYEQAWPFFRRDVPATLLLPPLRNTIAHRRIRGVSGRDGVAILLHMDELWIEEEAAEREERQ